MNQKITASLLLLSGIVTGGTAGAAPVYLNDANMSVALGASMSAEPFANRTAAASLASIIDAPSAAAGELHNQQTHVWVSGGILELDFDLGAAYDLTTLHFWNYFTETYDVDDIDLTFYDASMTLLGSILNISPAVGNASNDSTPILAQTIALNAPGGVRFVNAVLSGTNGQVDFNNMGFTGELSAAAVPEPSSMALLLFAAGPALLACRRRKAG